MQMLHELTKLTPLTRVGNVLYLKKNQDVNQILLKYSILQS